MESVEIFVLAGIEATTSDLPSMGSNVSSIYKAFVMLFRSALCVCYSVASQGSIL